MAREVYTDEEFIAFSREFVFMRVLSDKDPGGEQLKSRYQVEYTPTLLILNSKGREIDRIVGGRSTEELIEELEWIFKYESENPTIHL